MKKISLAEALEGIEDTRRSRSVMYPLHEILMIVLLGVMCGAPSYIKIEIYGKSKEKGADYCLSLKENQGNLYNDVKLYVENEIFTANRSELTRNGQYYRDIDKGHSRIEKREYYVCNDVSWLYCANEWKNLSGFGVCVSTVEQNGKITVSHNYSIYSVKSMTAGQFAVCKRGHWAIENSLHWVLDMVFREDESRARVDNSAENLNVFRQIAFNILKCDTSFKGGISDKQFCCLLDDRYLEKVVRNWVCS